jgi:alpha-D-ribose 1-methylphosphonate 5-triphosphate synthase subunit PhnL
MDMIRLEGVAKSFTLHTQGGVEIPVLQALNLAVRTGECLVLTGPSGAGKSSLLRMIYGNYRCSQGKLLVAHRGKAVDMATASPQTVLDVRRRTIGYVSQFLRVIPRIGTLDVVMAPLLAFGYDKAAAAERVRPILTRLSIPERLWTLPPNTFSGGEQQRVNIARALGVGFPILLLDEPTASLDEASQANVVELIEEAKAAETAIIGVFHNREVRRALATKTLSVGGCRAAA